MNSASTHLLLTRLRRLGLLLLLASVPACGLSDYEARMSETQKRADRFREESKSLDEPVKIPTAKDNEGKETPLAKAFFQPPKGIEARPQPEPRNNLLWKYKPKKSGSYFTYVEMAFAAEQDKDFASKVVNSYQSEQPLPTPQRTPPLPFDSWEFNDRDLGYSVNVSQKGKTKIAIVYVFRKGMREQVGRTIELSLRSLAVDQQVGAARERYNQKSPWQLGAPSGE